MRFWIAANLVLLSLAIATVGGVFLTTRAIFGLGLSPLNERIACAIAAFVIVVAVGVLFRRLLGRFQRRPPALKT